MSELRKTALYDLHLESKAKMVPFAGWDMPVEYAGLKAEHFAVREAVGIFDVSHMGEVKVTGSEATEYVNYIFTNDISNMKDYQVMYGLMCYEDGGVVDDMLVYKYNNEDYLLVVNASNIDKDFAWMQQNSSKFNVELNNISDDYSEVAIQGPKAQAVLQKVVDVDLSDIKFFYFNPEVMIEGVPCIVSRTGYTGEDGFEVYTDNDHIKTVWSKLLEAGADESIMPCGLGCRDTLRFEANLPLYGQEIDKDITPIEAGLSYFVKLDGPDFVGKDALLKQKAEGITKKVVGLSILDKGIPRHGYDVLKDGEKIGHITTGYISPSLGETVALALIDKKYANIDEELEVQIRKKTAKAVVRNRKFYTKNYKK